MNQKDEQTASKTQSELQPLLMQENQSRFIKMPPRPTKRDGPVIIESKGNQSESQNRLIVGSHVQSESRDALLFSQPQ